MAREARGKRGDRIRESSSASGRTYPRTARVGALLREVVADELERVSDEDDRLGLLTVTAVEPDPDFRHATVLLASISEEAAEGLEHHRVRLQNAIAREVRLKRTPLLRFVPDPAIEAGLKVEAALLRIQRPEDQPHEARDTDSAAGLGHAGGEAQGR
ncbi:MAG: ribosome-binding factor A [Actinobacteria bacterium]|nr:ribosome-binding factor A [Actinomycetota bacterium]